MCSVPKLPEARFPNPWNEENLSVGNSWVRCIVKQEQLIYLFKTYFKLPSKTALKQSDSAIEQHTSGSPLLGLSVEGSVTRLAVVLSAIGNKMLY